MTQSSSEFVAQRRWRDLLWLQASRSACDRVWEYFIPIYCANVVSAEHTPEIAARAATARTGLSITALLLGVRAFSGLILAPLFARLWMPERAFTFMLLENAALVVTGVALWFFGASGPSEVGTADAEEIEGGSLFWIVIAAISMAIEGSSSRTQQTNVEKHQVVRSFSVDSHNGVELLARANARMVQIDLVSATVSPFVVSLLASSSWIGFRGTVPFLIVAQVVVAAATSHVAVRVSLANTETVENSSLTSPKQARTHVSNSEQQHELASSQSFSFLGTDRRLSLVLLSSALVYFTVVSPNGLFLSWLSDQESATPFLVASVSAGGQIAGLVGSLTTPPLVSHCGLRWGSVVALTWQFVCVAGVALIVASGIGSHDTDSSGGIHLGLSFASVLLVCILCISSRQGLWSADLAMRQRVQSETTDASRMAVFGSLEAMCQLASLALYSVVSFELLGFSNLCIASACAVGSALIAAIFAS